jgi:transcriptional regulator with XRE-family HTH domain
MEKTFRRYLRSPAARHAFVEAEAVTSIAHQIRVLRTQRGWTQRELARRLGITQPGVARMEDPSYGRISCKSLLQLGKAFDVAPVFKFVSTIDLMRERWTIRRDSLQVSTFEDEAQRVVFVPPAQTVAHNFLPADAARSLISQEMHLRAPLYVALTTITNTNPALRPPLPLVSEPVAA